MGEVDFWAKLEFRLCREFLGLPERRFRYFWCDGFTPEQYRFNGPSPQITGRCWICNGAAQAVWNFKLLLPRPFESRETIDWGMLLPPLNVTRWLAIDEGRRYIEIEPAVAVPDLIEPGAAPAGSREIGLADS